jgi:1-deoxy-D-xylulose-5-phosphate reductoisomerase
MSVNISKQVNRKKVSILGSTGSIGCNTLRVIEAFGDEFEVVALGAGSNIGLLADQIERFRPQVASVGNEAGVDLLLAELRRRGVAPPAHIGIGVDGLVEVATCDGAEIVIGAVVGALGLLPTWRALQLGRRVALANK